ncbi:SRR1-like protein [Anopheles merus]|uniref:SRR1 domain-containing protein n=1 Tax=Anopheles merus TaxID=30066 RepID=A0A182V117_ANOME|nr:SRR1-like protein [Anopheles merus]
MSEVDAIANELDFKLVVTRKGKHRPRQRNKAHTFSHQLEDKERVDQTEFCQKTVLTQLQQAEADLLQSEFLRECLEKLEPVLVGVQDIICLGLGNFFDCTIARYQLAFIRCVRNKANLVAKGQFFDPVFTPSEVDTLQHALGETVLQENLEGKYSVERKTLFFLPHCPKQIVNNLLWKNWYPNRLPNVVLLCNSFSTVVNNAPDRLLRINAGYILRAVDLFQEVPLRNSFRFGDIFNDTSLHYFANNDRPAGDNAAVWDCTVEPSYAEDDLELISKEKVAKLTFA